jgi:hypothetical protein
MDMVITHPAARRLAKISPISSLIRKKPEDAPVTTVLRFINAIQKAAVKIEKSERLSAYYKPNDFKGHALEVLVEFWIKNSPFNNEIGILNYTPVFGDGDD